MDHSELDLLVDAGKRTVGIQKVRCPLCRAGLVTLESGSIQPASSGQEVGLVQLEEDDHIATHIHEFALHSFPSPDEATSEKSSLSCSSPSTREEITTQGPQDLKRSPNEQNLMYSRSDIDGIFEDIKRELATGFVRWESSARNHHRANDTELFTEAESRFHYSKENIDLDAFALVLNESRVVISQLKDFFPDSSDESQYEELWDDLDRNQERLFSILDDPTASDMAFESQSPHPIAYGSLYSYYSLWDTAYDALRKEEPDRISAYEDLLSRVPTRGKLQPVLGPLFQPLT